MTENRKKSFLVSVICLLTSVLCAPSAQALPLIRDAEIEHTLRAYADPIFTTAGLKPSKIRIFIVNDDGINAYVAGGENMFVHAGLILAADTPDMIIGVMAHETGHISGGHLAKGAEKLKDAQLGSIMTYVLGAAAAVATKKPEAAAAVITGGQNAVTRDFLAYTRAHEEAADQAALGFLDKLGISASGLVKMFTLLQRNERQYAGSIDPYMVTHPLSATRIDHVRDHASHSTIPSGQYPRQFDAMHKRMVAKLYGFLKSPERTLQQYPQSDKSVSAHMARAIAYYKMPDLPRALVEMDAMMAEAKDDAFLYDLRGQILFENNRVEDALAAYEKAAKLQPSAPLILTELGKVEMAAGGEARVRSAIIHLEKATLLDNSNADSWRLLATAYGKSGDKAMASLALAEEAALQDDLDVALARSEQAISGLKPSTPASLRAQDIKNSMLKAIQARKESESGFH